MQGLPAAKMTVHHYRVDGDHSNTHTAWQALGSPDYPTRVQMAILRSRQGLELMEPARTVETADGWYQAAFRLPMHGVSLINLKPAE